MDKTTGRWLFPYRAPRGVSVYKPRWSSPDVAWHLRYKLDRRQRRPNVERVSPDVGETYRRALAVGKLLAEGRGDPDAAKLAKAERQPLVGIPPAAGRRKGTPGHLDDYERVLLDEGATKKHAAQVKRRARWVIDHNGWTRPSQVSAEGVRKALGDLRRHGSGAKGHGPCSAQTSNHFLRAVKQLTAWMAGNGRLAKDPLEQLAAMSVEADRRHDRQDLGEEKAGRLLAAARSGPDVLGVSGEARAMLYETSLESGLRGNELATLTPRRCHLTTGPQEGETFKAGPLAKHPVLVVKAGYAKNRREDHQPVRREFALRLMAWLAGKPLDVPVWKVPAEPVDLLRDDVTGEGDLVRAGIGYVDAEGRYADFHALRHTYIMRLVRAGVHITEVRVLARHASITTTERYFRHHLKLHDTAAAVAKLSPLPPPKQPQAARATGTHGGATHEKQAARAQRKAQRAGVAGCRRVSLNDVSGEGGAAAADSANQSVGKELEVKPRSQLAGLEPATFGSVDRTPLQGNSQQNQPVTDAPEGGRSAKRSAPASLAELSPDQLRGAVEKVTAMIRAGRARPEHVAGLLAVEQAVRADEREGGPRR